MRSLFNVCCRFGENCLSLNDFLFKLYTGFIPICMIYYLYINVIVSRKQCTFVWMTMDSILSKSSTSFFLCVSCRLFCIFIYWCRLFRLCRQFSHFFSFFILISETKYVNSLSSLHINPHTQHIHNYRNILYFQSYSWISHTHPHPHTDWRTA